MTDVSGLTALWRDNPNHRRWLDDQANRLFSFFEDSSIDPAGGFHALDDTGQAIPGEAERPLHVTTRMVHCFAIGHLLGRPGSLDFVNHGMEALLRRHRDRSHGGYFWSFDGAGPRDRQKLAYGHAFVLLAASSAKCVGHPDADGLLADVSQVLEERFWDAHFGAYADEFAEDWTPISQYRGQNANMHLAEALMAAFEATGESLYLERARSIAKRILRDNAAAAQWRVPEHYRADWTVDRDYKGSDVFRPYGTTPGHSLEWARLAAQLWELGGRADAWLPDAARALFAAAVDLGWDHERGGFYYTLDWSGAPHIRDRLWWPCCEGIGAARFLSELADDPTYERWYRAIWNFTSRHLLDRRRGGWLPQLDDKLSPTPGYFVGKPDLYHALQACLIPLYPATGSLTRGILRATG